MSVTFTQASNNEQTCTAGEIKLHSFYNPSKEGQRFADTAQCNFNPKYILVSEPGISYCAQYLKERFSKSILCCVRYTDEFKQFDSKWDKVFHSSKMLSEDIFNFMGEEGICACLFLSWKASEKAFENQSMDTWNEIKKSVLKSRSILATRSFFAKRWAKNSLRFSLFADKSTCIAPATKDIIVCASGPSLISSIENLKKFRKRFFLIAVSSALSPLVHNGIIPDLCISTDGGYWAKLHISFALKNNNIPLALPGEGSCFASILNKTRLIPLFYGDGISEDILNSSGYKKTKAVRNGSVSGTAAYLALSLTSGNVYFCGLDLCYSKGHVHTQPNELEINDLIHDGRLRTTETRISASVLNKESINIYRDWFASTDFKGRLMRLSDNFNYASKLGKTDDVNWNYFINHTEDFKSKIDPVFKDYMIDSKTNRVEMLRKICTEKTADYQWIKNALPAEALIQERTDGIQDENNMKENITIGMKKFSEEILRAIEK